METVKYQLESIKLLEEQIPGNAIDFNAKESEVQWEYTLTSGLDIISDEEMGVHITINVFLYRVDDPAKKSIVLMKVKNYYSVARNISAEAQRLVLLRFINNALWNLQGIYALKTDNTPFSAFLPPPCDFMQSNAQPLKSLLDGWS
jgi:hypothetical protein